MAEQINILSEATVTLTTFSSLNEDDFETAFTVAAPTPRSAKGSTAAIEITRVYWEKLSVPKFLRISADVSSENTADTGRVIARAPADRNRLFRTEVVTAETQAR